MAIDRSRLDRGLAVADGLVAATTEPPSASINTLTIRGSGTVGALPLVDALGVGSGGHELHVVVAEPEWRFDLHDEGDARPHMSDEGDPSAVLTGAEIAALRHAIDAADPVAALGVLGNLTCSFQLVVRNDPSHTGAHWVADRAALIAALIGPRWPATLTVLAAGPPVILVTEPAHGTARIGGFVLLGADASDQSEAIAPPLADDEFRATRPRPFALPSPLVFAVHPGDIDDRALRAAFAGTCRFLVWWWLAADATLEHDAAVLTVRGAKIVRLRLQPTPAEQVDADVALYRWVASLTDPARAEAVQQAASLAIASADDLRSAAEPVLRTARSLDELARRGAVAEALAARRTAALPPLLPPATLAEPPAKLPRAPSNACSFKLAQPRASSSRARQTN